MWKTKVFHASFFSARADKTEVISISILLFSSIGMISAERMHPYWTLLLHRDYFTPVRCIPDLLFCSTGITLPRSDASLSGSFAPQGLFRPAECISIWFFCAAGIISVGRIHPITGRPSLKTSLPGHFVNFKFAEHHPLSFQGAHPWLG